MPRRALRNGRPALSKQARWADLYTHAQEDHARKLPCRFAHQSHAKGQRRNSAIGNLHPQVPRPCGCQNLGPPGGGSTWVPGLNRIGPVSRVRARAQPLMAKMQDSLGERLRYLPTVTFAAAGRSGSVSGVSVTRQGWQTAHAGSKEVSKQTELAMSHFFTLHRCNQTDTRVNSYRPIFRGVLAAAIPS